MTNHSSPGPGLHDGRVVGEHADGALGRRHVGPLHYGHGGVVQADLDMNRKTSIKMKKKKKAVKIQLP